MSRLDYVTIAIVAVCVAALVYLIYMTTNLLGGEETAEQPEMEAPAEDPSYQEERYQDDSAAAFDADTSGTYEESGAYYEEDYYAEGDPSAQGEYEDDGYQDEGYQDGGYQDGGYQDEDVYRDKGSYAEESEAVPASRPAEDYPSVNAGDYMVLAGTFKIKSNAENRVRQLRDMGYTDASVEIFDRGAYAVALVDHFSELNEAKQVANKLESEGVPTYVKRKQ